jgi:hypothetical protein
MVKDCDKWFLFPMLLKCHHDFTVLKFEFVIDWLNNEDSRLTHLKWLLKAMSHQGVGEYGIVGVLEGPSWCEDISCLFRWLGKHESLFPTIALMTHIFFEIVGSQIEIEKIFSLFKILMNLRRCM